MYVNRRCLMTLRLIIDKRCDLQDELNRTYTDNLPDCQHSRFHRIQQTSFHPKNSITSLKYYTRFLNPRIMISIQTCQLVSMFTEMEIYIWSKSLHPKKKKMSTNIQLKLVLFPMQQLIEIALPNIYTNIYMYLIFFSLIKIMKRTHSFRESNDMTICDFIYIYIYTYKVFVF